MPSPDSPPAVHPPEWTERTVPDVGPGPHSEAASLWAPVSAGTPVEALVTDEAWLQAMLDAEAGLARAQARLGTVPPEVAATVSRVAHADRFDLTALARHARAAANPVVPLVAALRSVVAEVDPVAAEYVHRGSTSQDILDTGLMLLAARALAEILKDLDRVAAALADTADTHRGTTMPGRTLTQHAVPVTFGLKAAGWLLGVLDVRQRLRAVRAGLPVQLGGAAGTLAGYLEFAAGTSTSGGDPTAVDGSAAASRYADRLMTAFADELGLREPVLPWHTVRTPVAELGATLALVTGALGKIAVDVQSLARTEVSELVEPPAAGRGVSSAMPQKRNPVLATLIRSAALQVPQLAAVLAGCMLAEDERPAGVWQAEWQPTRDCLRLAGGAAHTAAELVEGFVPDPHRMQANLRLTRGLIVAERVAAVLTPVLGAAAARRLVTGLSVRSAREGRPLGELLAATPEVTDRFTSEDLARLLEPAGYVGAAGMLVDRVLNRYGMENHH
jgi:3-carboxy-cis,cis-muconate cycloisomerase